MAPSSATKIYPFEDYQRKSPLKNRKDGFEGLMRIVKSLRVLSRPQRCLLGIIVSACFDDGVFTKSKAWLCQEYDGAYSTICRLLNQLDSIGFIELDGRGANQRIFPTELCYIDDPVELKKQYDLIQKEKRKTDTLVLKNDRKSIKNENYTYISSKNFSKTDTAPPPEPPSEPPPNPPEKPPEKNEPTAVLFHKNTKEKLGPYHQAIAKYCAIIITMSGYSEKLNPIKIVKWALKSNVHPKAIEDSLKFVTSFKSLDDVDPYAVVRNRSRTKTHKYNAKDAENECDKRKKEAIRNGKIVVLMKTI